MIKLLNVIQADHDQDLYLVFEYMGECFIYFTVKLPIKRCVNILSADTDLHAAIKANILHDVHKQYVIYQVSNCHCPCDPWLVKRQ